MDRILRLAYWILLSPLFCHTAVASHIAGGNIEFVAAAKPGQYQLSLNLYIDDASKGPDATLETTIIVSVFRSRDHQLMSDYSLKFVRQLPLVYANPACASNRGLVTSEIRYSALVQLDPARFNDPAGYYIVWEKCCRNQNVVNVRSPQASGMIYYLTFPALLRGGASFRNSSPVFLTPNAEYICVNKPFSLAFRATDADGDELRYSLVTPYNDNIYKPYGFNNSPNSPAYRLLQWEPGFSEQQAITGNPALSVGRTSGVLSVQPDRLGLFAFTVLCEEYRGGVKIGEVRRDHQILVVDCAAKVPPKPSIAAVGPAGNSPLEFCEGSAVLLRTDADTTFNYQWQRDGYNLPGQTKSVLRTVEPGEYRVVKSFAVICTRDSVSEAFKLTLKPSSRAVITALDTVLCPSRPLLLTANQQAGLKYQWQTASTDIPGAQQPVYTVPKAGKYRLKTYNETTDCTALDSVTVLNSPLQRVRLSATGSQSLCEGNALATIAEPETTKLTYIWTHDGLPLNNAVSVLPNAMVGNYVVTVTDTTQCALSAVARVNPRPRPVIDSLPPVCGPSAGVVPLSASPVGGLFSGPGVTGATFNPAVAGLGQQRIRYAVTNAFGCKADTSRSVTVLNVPKVDLGPDKRVLAGSSLRLDGPTGSGLSYQWEPVATVLSVNSSLVVRPAQTTTYRLTVRLNGACPVTDDMLVEVLPNLFVPTAFSPNGDGLNDTWALKGIDAFPECSVRIYDRWGELMYQAASYKEPWDGRYRGNPVATGVYEFVIRPAPDQPEQRGTVMLVL